jgi:hypothetical protein
MFLDVGDTSRAFPDPRDEPSPFRHAPHRRFAFDHMLGFMSKHEGLMRSGPHASTVGHRERDRVECLPGIAGGVDTLHRRLLRPRVGLVDQTRRATLELAAELLREPTGELGVREHEETGDVVTPSFPHDEFDAARPVLRFEHAAALDMDSAPHPLLNVRVPPLGAADGRVAEGEAGPALPATLAIVNAAANDTTGTVNVQGDIVGLMYDLGDGKAK